jgi:hypothetical protein
MPQFHDAGYAVQMQDRMNVHPARAGWQVPLVQM